MTLIINAATQGFVVHASDRLLTKRVAGKSRIHSDVENKSLIVVATDAICIIGYTGAAYIQGLNTDTWIASVITEKTFSDQFMTQLCSISGLKLNTIIWRLKNAISSLVLPGNANYLGISISGIRNRRGYIRSFIHEIERNRGVVCYKGYMRAPKSPQFHSLSQIGDTIAMKKLQQIIGQNFERYGVTALSFQRGVIDAIREKANISKTVGDEIMTIIITLSEDGWNVAWKYDAPRPRLGQFVNKEGEIKCVFESYFSPWIISSAFVTAPSFGNGHLDHIIGNVTIHCENDIWKQSKKGNLMAVSSHQRTPQI